MEPNKTQGAADGKLWVKTPVQNLIRYAPSGTYYLRGRFGGEPLRESLGTDNFRVAKLKLSERMRELRSAVPRRGGPASLHEALLFIRKGIEGNQRLKAASRSHYLMIIDELREGGTTEIEDARFSSISSEFLRDWWHDVSSRFSPMRANQALMMVKRAIQIGKKAGAVRGDPFEHLERMRIPKTNVKILTSDQLRAIIDAIRTKPGAGKNSANWASFAAYSGMRPAEIDALRWRDITDDTITVRGGETGTKNHLIRHIPIIPPMRSLLGTMTRGKPDELVFTKGRPRRALKSACERLGLPHMRVYDLRHTFATFCVSAGVDVPTLAKWLGHQDGGALAMRTYIHTTDDHSKRIAQKVTFE